MHLISASVPKSSETALNLPKVISFGVEDQIRYTPRNGGISIYSRELSPRKIVQSILEYEDLPVEAIPVI